MVEREWFLGEVNGLLGEEVGGVTVCDKVSGCGVDVWSPLLQNSSHVDRRSMPSMGYMTHTVSAPSLHGKSVSSASFLGPGD